MNEFQQSKNEKVGYTNPPIAIIINAWIKMNKISFYVYVKINLGSGNKFLLNTMHIEAAYVKLIPETFHFAL